MKKYSDIINSHLEDSKNLLTDMKAEINLKSQLFAENISASLKKNGKLLWCGNGGSASECLHLSAELVGRFINDREPLNSIALTSDISVLTCISNDYSFEEIFSRQVSAIGKKGDILICLSTSGNSKNVINAIETAKDIGLEVICLLGKGGGEASKICRNNITVRSKNTARIQEMHLLIGHLIVELTEYLMGYG